MLGTDYPFPLGEVSGYAGAYPGKAVEEAEAAKEITEGVRRGVLFDNAIDFLRLDASQFGG